jgi:hypothetical protein
MSTVGIGDRGGVAAGPAAACGATDGPKVATPIAVAVRVSFIAAAAFLRFRHAAAGVTVTVCAVAESFFSHAAITAATAAIPTPFVVAPSSVLAAIAFAGAV